MKNIADNLRFFLLLVRRGSMANRDVNHERERRENLERLPIQIIPAGNRKHNFQKKILHRLLKARWMRFLLGNIAFLKNPERSYRRFFVCNDKKLIYLRIFKCGSTSVLRNLLPCIHKPLYNFSLTDKQIDAIAHYLERNHLHNLREYTSFTIVRNPLERVVSAYVDIFTNHDYGDFLCGIFKKGMTFKEVVKTLALVPDRFRGPHFASQNAIIYYSGIKNLTCFKLREDSEKLKAFLSKFDLQFDHANKAITQYDFRNFYDVETLQLVYEIYKFDFTNLGYTQQYEELLASIKSD
jgi:hypothetical protein